MAEDEDVEVGVCRLAAQLAPLRLPGLVHHPEPDALDLDLGELRKPLTQHSVVVVAHDADQTTRP